MVKRHIGAYSHSQPGVGQDVADTPDGNGADSASSEVGEKMKGKAVRILQLQLKFTRDCKSVSTKYVVSRKAGLVDRFQPRIEVILVKEVNGRFE